MSFKPPSECLKAETGITYRLTGRQFQADGDDIANARGPIVEVFVLGRNNRPDAADRR